MKNKSMLLIIMVLVLSVALIGCSGGKDTPADKGTDAPADSGTDAAWEFERPIEVIIPFGPGSGTDTTIRAWAPLMEKELGITININNVEGAGGVRGAEFHVNQPADGYTYAMYTPSHIIAGVDGTASFDIINDTMQVVRLVQDSNVILAGTHVPYNNVAELVEYAKANPDKKPTLGMMSINGIDGASATQLFEELGIDVEFIPYASGAEANAAIMGGHTDMVLTSPFDGNAYLESGDMKGIVVLSEERASNMPDVECTGELGINAFIGPWRAIVAAKGTPQAAIDAIEAAAIKVNDMQEWTDWKETVGLNDREGWANQEEFKKLWFDYVEVMKELRGQ